MKSYFTIKASADRKAEIDIFGNIGNDWWTGEGNTVQTITERLAAVKALDADEVVVHINSLGGDLSQGIAIYDALKKFGDKLTVELSGYCASAATVIAMAGKKRCMAKHDLILMHKCWGGVVGNENDLQAAIEEQRIMNNSMVQIYSETTGLSVDDIEAIMNENNGNGRWMAFDEALEKGFITDDVAEPNTNALYASARDIAVLNLPPLPMGYEREDEQRMLPYITQVVTNLFNEKMSKTEEMAAMKEQLETANASVEASNAKVAELNAQVEELTKAKSEMEEAKAALETEKETLNAKVAELQALVDAHAEGQKQVNGSDNPNVDSFAKYQAESGIYDQYEEELALR